LGKAPELPRVQPFPFLRLELLQRLETDLEVLSVSLGRELAGHARELDLAMQRLVRHAKQCAVGNPKTKAVRSDGGRFHVERDCTRLRQSADDGGMVAELPIA